MDATLPHPTRRLLLAGGLASAATAGCSRSVASELPRVGLPGLDGLKTGAGWPVPGIAEGQFDGRVSLLNVWASWCPGCRAEHATLLRLAGDGRFQLVGLVSHDKPDAARSFIRRNGNPFAALAMDSGVFWTALGRPGFPTTFVIDRRRRVAATFVGEIDETRFRDKVLPATRAALDG